MLLSPALEQNKPSEITWHWYCVVIQPNRHGNGGASLGARAGHRWGPPNTGGCGGRTVLWETPCSLTQGDWSGFLQCVQSQLAHVYPRLLAHLQWSHLLFVFLGSHSCWAKNQILHGTQTHPDLMCAAYVSTARAQTKIKRRLLSSHLWFSEVIPEVAWETSPPGDPWRHFVHCTDDFLQTKFHICENSASVVSLNQSCFKLYLEKRQTLFQLL